jgi:hypothetical protein
MTPSPETGDTLARRAARTLLNLFAQSGVLLWGLQGTTLGTPMWTPGPGQVLPPDRSGLRPLVPSPRRPSA